MPYAFPGDLADQIAARWHTFVARHDRPAPPLPPAAHLRHILDTAFFASFVREEARDLRFVLCCAPGTEVPREGTSETVPVVLFDAPRPLTVPALRALAPAVSPGNAAILVHCPADDVPVPACEIAGLLNVGSNLARARSGRAFYHRPAPYALVIDVRDAGELHAYRGGIKLALLKSGSLHDQLAFSELEFLPISDILALGTAALDSRMRGSVEEPARETADFAWTALLNTILSVVSGIREHGHGGTLLLVAPGAEPTVPVRAKFDIHGPGTVLTERFAAFVNARNDLVGRQWAHRQTRASAGEAALPHLENATYVAEEELADATDLVARLSAVDGALVIGSDLRVLGFGAEIVVDASRAVTAYDGSGPTRRVEDAAIVDSESFGMRHRSALRCVAVADGTAAFVVSQDGTVSFFWKHAGRVLVKRDVNISNPNMAGM
jgi:hypothetical protein